jgi:capsular polysaccharide transport system permease protein
MALIGRTLACSTIAANACRLPPMPDASQFVTYARLLRLTPVADAPSLDLAPTYSTPLTEAPKPRWQTEGWVSFALLVLVPTILAAIYFWAIAAPRYLSEAQFVLRLPSAAGPSLGDIKTPQVVQQATGMSKGSEDGYAIQEFLNSRDAMQWLMAKADLKRAFEAGHRDPLWGFPNILASNTEEGLFKLFKRMTWAGFDNATGVMTLRVQAFAPGDAQRMTAALLEAAEAMVNRLNDRVRRDAQMFAEGESDRMLKRVVAAQRALVEFREREQLIDPEHATLAILETIAKLATEVAAVSVQITELQRNTPGGPQLAPLRARREALETQITYERHRLAGDSKSIAPRIADYERLMLEREFASKALIAAMTAVETTRMDAQRQQIYVERIATPSRPDYAAYPWRIIWTVAILFGGLMAWRIWRLIVRDAMRHLD